MLLGQMDLTLPGLIQGRPTGPCENAKQGKLSVARRLSQWVSYKVVKLCTISILHTSSVPR